MGVEKIEFRAAEILVRKPGATDYVSVGFTQGGTATIDFKKKKVNVDQFYGAIDVIPEAHEAKIDVTLVETDLDNLLMALGIDPADAGSYAATTTEPGGKEYKLNNNSNIAIFGAMFKFKKRTQGASGLFYEGIELPRAYVIGTVELDVGKDDVKKFKVTFEGLSDPDNNGDIVRLFEDTTDPTV